VLAIFRPFSLADSLDVSFPLFVTVVPFPLERSFFGVSTFLSAGRCPLPLRGRSFFLSSMANQHFRFLPFRFVFTGLT